MIELLGVGVPRKDGGWLLHRVCARWDRSQLVAVVSEAAENRLALLDAVAGCVVPEEGRVWVGGVPLTRETVGRLRVRVREVDLRLPVAERRSLLWNTLAGSRPGLGALQGLLRLPRPGERRAAVQALHSVGLPERARDAAGGLDREERARLALARALLRRPEHLVVREVDLTLGLADAERLLDLLRAVARADRLSVAASVASLSLARRFADRVVVMAEGLLVFDAPPHILSEDEVAWRLRRRAPSSVARY